MEQLILHMTPRKSLMLRTIPPSLKTLHEISRSDSAEPGCLPESERIDVAIHKYALRTYWRRALRLIINPSQANMSFLRFSREKLQVGDIVRLKSHVILRIKDMTAVTISGDALLPFKQIVDEDNYTTCNGRLVRRQHRQPCETGKDATMIDGDHNEGLTELTWPLVSEDW